MTCREKLAIEHPDRVGEDFVSGCNGCPPYYGYLSRPDYCERFSLDDCERCWDREIPEHSKHRKEGDI